MSSEHGVVTIKCIRCGSASLIGGQPREYTIADVCIECYDRSTDKEKGQK